MRANKIEYLQDCAVPMTFVHVKAKKKRESSTRHSEVAAKKQVRTT